MEQTNATQFKPQVACIGILVADLFVPPLPRLPEAGELLRVDDFLLSVGGCAANTAVDLARLGGSAAVFGKVGQDLFGDFVVQELARQGAKTDGISRSARQPTSRTVILPVAGEDRRYIHSVGANADFTLSDVDLDRVFDARILYVGGYLLLPGVAPRALFNLFNKAQQRGMATVLDIAGVRPGDLGLLTEVLPAVNLFLPNRDEAAALTGTDDVAEQAELFLQLGAEQVGITLGEEGAFVSSRTERIQAAPFAVHAVDASGGGDAFAAGCMVGLLEGWDLARTVTFASAVGALACTALGCTLGVRSRAETEAFIHSQPARQHIRSLRP